MAEIVDFGLQQHKIKMDSRYFENVLSVVAGDTGRRIEVQLLDTNGMVQNTTGLSLRLNAEIAGKTTFTDATLVDAATGKYRLDLSNGMFLAPGNWQFQWQITDSAGKKLHSFAFTGNVGKNISEGGSQATNFYLNLEDLKKMQDDLINGTIDSSILETNITEILTDLETQYAPKLTKVTAQLAETATFNQKTNVSDTSSLTITKKSSKRPLVSFIDDDGYSEVMTRLKPIFDAKGVNGTLAIVSSWVGTTGCLSKSDLTQLQNEGWEIASHEKTHIAMGSITDKIVIQREIAESKRDLLRMGFNVKNIVYPYGQVSVQMLETVKQNYRSGVITSSAANDTTVTFPLDTYGVRRVDFSGATLDHYKAVVDKAITEDSWIVFMTHIKVQKPEYDTMLGTLIDYIQSKGVEIVPFDKGLDTFGDTLSIEGITRILPDGSFLSDTIVPVYRTLTNALTADSLIDSFKLGGITNTQITPAGAATFPEGQGGLLTTDRTFKDGGYHTQTYRIYNTSTTYERYYKVTGAWSDWQRISKVVQFSLLGYDFGIVPANGTVTYNIVIPGAVLSLKDPAILTTTSILPNNMIATAKVINGNTVQISVRNPNTTAYSTANNSYYGYVLK